MAAIIDKAELKRAVIQEIGKELDKKREAAEQEVLRFDGSRSALNQVASKITEHASYWQKDFDDNKCTKEELDAALKAIDQCAGIARNLSDSAITSKLIKQGELAAFDKSSGVCEKLFEAEGQRAQAFLAAMERGEITSDGIPTDKAVAGEGGRPPLRMVGQHPGSNVAQMRKQQEAGAVAEQEEAKAPAAPAPKPSKGNGESKPAPKAAASKGKDDKKAEMPPARRRRRKAAPSKGKG
jgi:hypothetical protein